MTNVAALDAALAQIKMRRRLPPPPSRCLIRERAGLSQEALAATVGVTRVAVSYWESGKRAPRAANLARYIEVLERLAREPLG